MPTLDFKGKQHIYAHHLAVPYRPLIADPSRSVSASDSSDGNLIIHGDNLHALKALLPRYAGRIDCIYIDPPYNTGNEGWIYNDKVNSPLLKEWFKSQSPVDGEDLERHDKWLCMMWPRLQLMRELLADDGAIFVSIDDNEQHHLRMLMDEIFGADNFVANITWRKKTGGGQDSQYFAGEHDYVISYRKSESFVMNFRTVEVLESDFRKTKNGRSCQFVKLEKWGAGALRTDRPTLFYPITDPDGNDFYPQAPNGEEGRWRTSPIALDADHIHWEKRKGRWTPLEVIYFDEVDHKKRVKDRTIFYDIATTTTATNEQKIIFGRKVMDNNKPVALVQRIADIAAGKNSIILDSFAGSGTTAHAVLALNKEDGGNRRVILVECEDYADSITAERVRRVIGGVAGARDESLREGLGGSFAYCELGDPIDEEGMLTAESPPSRAALAAYLLHVSSGMSADGADFADDAGADADGLFYRGETTDYYLLYRPDREWLRGGEGMLSEARARRIAEAIKPAGRKAVVFAPGKYIGQRELTRMGITFCQLPYEIYRAPA